MDIDSTSDKISYRNNLTASQRLRNAVLEMYDDGYTIHEIHASIPGILCPIVANIISQVIKDDAEQCA